MTSTVVKEAGLATRGKGLTFDLASNQFEQSQQLTDATLRLGDKELSIDGAQVIPDDDLGAYVPVPHYGGVLGVEVFRRGIVRIDLTHAQLVLSARADTAHASDAIELPLEQNAADAQLDRLPIVPLALDGQSGKFRIIFSGTSVDFLEASPLGRTLLDRSPHPVTILQWTPNGIVRSQDGKVAQLEIGGHPLGRTSISRRSDPMPTRRNVRLALHEPPFDGVIGVRVLGRFDITIDNPAGEAWLAPRSKSSLRCHGTPPTTFHGTTGFRPWLYKGQAIVASLQEGSPAEAAGIKPGDSILSIDGGDVFAYYDHLDATCLAPAPVKVTFRNASGDHTVVLTPAMPYQDKNGDSGSTSQPDK